MRKGQVFIIASLVLFSILGIYSFGVLAKDITTETHAPSCYVIFSPHARLEQDPDHPEQGQLVLQDVEATVNTFTLTPSVQGKKVAMSLFLTHWAGSPLTNLTPHSNEAGLVTYDDKTKAGLHLSLALDHPRYDASKKLLIFDASLPTKQALTSHLFDQVVLYVEAP